MNEKRVFILKSDCVAYSDPPFHPGEEFPELDAKEIDRKNRIYGLVRETLYGLGMDCDKFGTKEWNPLREFVKPFNKVVIKPNLVFDAHIGGKRGVEAMVTHPSIIRPLIDYVLKASEGKAYITICDAPLQSASWDNLVNQNLYQGLVDYYNERGINIELLDLRTIRSYCNKYGGIQKTVNLQGDPRGNCIVNLDFDSCFEPIIGDFRKFEITGYPSGTVAQHHNTSKNEYLISRTILESDVFINLPKMKTHKKAGVSLSLKNLIGINADKSWIAHHRKGSIEDGGDEYDIQPSSFRIRLKLIHYFRQYKLGVIFLTYFFSPMKRFLSNLKNKLRQSRKFGEVNMGSRSRRGGNNVVTEGSWYGNNTIWRTILDINRCLFYADKEGYLRINKNRQRSYLTLIDGIVGMEKEGPLEGVPKEVGCLIAAFNPVASDYVAASIMGFDPNKIPTILESFKLKKYKLAEFKAEEIEIDSNYSFYKDPSLLDWKKSLKFIPPKTWQGHVEKKGFTGEWKEPYRLITEGEIED
jgi:uncharacterized protein (DUF362 family)